jgi:hypothetical protein
VTNLFTSEDDKPMYEPQKGRPFQARMSIAVHLFIGVYITKTDLLATSSRRRHSHASDKFRRNQSVCNHANGSDDIEIFPKIIERRRV